MKLVLIFTVHPGSWKAIFVADADVATVRQLPGRRRPGFNDSRVVTVESAREDYGVSIPPAPAPAAGGAP